MNNLSNVPTMLPVPSLSSLVGQSGKCRNETLRFRRILYNIQSTTSLSNPDIFSADNQRKMLLLSGMVMQFRVKDLTKEQQGIVSNMENEIDKYNMLLNARETSQSSENIKNAPLEEIQGARLKMFAIYNDLTLKNTAEQRVKMDDVHQPLSEKIQQVHLTDREEKMWITNTNIYSTFLELAGQLEAEERERDKYRWHPKK